MPFVWWGYQSQSGARCSFVQFGNFASHSSRTFFKNKRKKRPKIPSDSHPFCISRGGSNKGFGDEETRVSAPNCPYLLTVRSTKQREKGEGIPPFHLSPALSNQDGPKKQLPPLRVKCLVPLLLTPSSFG